VISCEINNTFLLSIYLPGYTISFQGAKIIIKNDKLINSNVNVVRELTVYRALNSHKRLKGVEES
jgi:hypothetical protein